MAINIRQTPGFDRSTSGIYEKMGITEAEGVKQAKDTLKMEEGQVVEGTVCENKGQKSIEIQGEEIPVSSEAVKDYEVGETLYLKVDTKEEGKIALKILSSAEVEQIKAGQAKTEQVKTEQIKSGQTRVDSKKNPYHTGIAMAKSPQDTQGISRKIEAATKEIAKLLKESKVTVTVTKDVGKAVEKVVNELDTSHLNQLETQKVEVENTDVRTLSNMLSNIEHQEQNELKKEEIMNAAVEKGKELSTFPDGKMYYMISNELELTVNNLYKAEYSYDKDYQSQPLTKAEWEQLKPKVEEYLKKEQIAPKEENMSAAKWLMDHKLPITKANVADVKAMQTLSENGVKEEVLRDNVEHYFELKLDPKEANVFYENEGKVAEKLMEKVGQLNEKDLDAAIRKLVKEEKPLTLDNMLKEVEKQETAGKGTNEVPFYKNPKKESGYEDQKNRSEGNPQETRDSNAKKTVTYGKETEPYEKETTAHIKGKAAYENGKSTYEDVKAAYENVKTTYEDVKAAYENGKATYEDVKAAYENVKSAYEDVKVAYEKETGAYEVTKKVVSGDDIREENKVTEKIPEAFKDVAKKESEMPESTKNVAKKEFEVPKSTKNVAEREFEVSKSTKNVAEREFEVPKSTKNVAEKEFEVSKSTKNVAEREFEVPKSTKNVTKKESEGPESSKNITKKTAEIPEGEKKTEERYAEVSGKEKESADSEQVLDELDSQDINYRKIENQEKREQATKKKKEDTTAVKEDISYEQLGKVHFKRQTRRFSIADVAKDTEARKRRPSETIKESETQHREPEKGTDKGIGMGKVLSEKVDQKESKTVVSENALNNVDESSKIISESVINKVDETSKVISENVKKKEDTHSEKENGKSEDQKTERTGTEKIESKIDENKTDSLLKNEAFTKWEVERKFFAQKKQSEQERKVSLEETKEVESRVSSDAEMKEESKISSDVERKKEENSSSTDEAKRNETRESFAKEGKGEEEPKESLSKEQSTLLFGTTGGAGTVSETAVRDNKEEKKASDFRDAVVKGNEENNRIRKEDFNKESKNHFGDRREKPSLNTKEYSELREVVREDADVSETKNEFSKGQNREAASSFNGAELEAKIIIAKRQLEEIRLKLTLSSAKLLAKNDIKIDTKELSEIVDQLKELEKEACKRQLIENRIEPTEENIEQFRITTKMAEELKEMPSYSIAKFVREPIPMTMEGLHEEGRKLKTGFDAANERYETMMTKPRSDMGDSISKAFRNVDDILKEMDLEVTEANQRAVRILGYNSMEITEENLEAVKAKDLSVNRLLNQLTPQTVMEFIRKGENIIKIPVEELNLKMEAMNNEAQEKEVARYSEFLYKLEKNKEITPEERTAFVGVYRLLDKVVKSKGRDIGALVKSGQEITLKNLLTAQRTIKASKIDANIDDDFGMVSEVIEKGVKITDQIEQGFSNVSKTTNQMEQGFSNVSKGTNQMEQGFSNVSKGTNQMEQGFANVSGNSVLDSFMQEGAKNSALAGVGNQNASYLNMGGQTVLETANQEVVQQEATQQVEKEQQREQDSKMQQTISYQQDLAKEILEYVNPSDLKALSKVFGDNLENMTFEQIKDRLSRTTGKNFETAFTGEPVLDEYQEEQMKEWKQLAQTEQRVMKALSDFDVSKTLSNAKAFETIFSKESPLFEQIKKEFEPKNKKEEKEKKIQKSISSLGGFFDGKEEAVRAYDDFAEELMDESGSQEPLTTKDILARKNLMLAGNLMAKIAREESFIVPVQIQNKDTTMEVTLKSKGTEKGTIQASVVAGNWGEISAELLVEDGKVSVYSKAESKDGEAALNKALGVFEGALSKHHIALQKTEQPIQGTGNASTRQLYQVAKSFVEAFRA